MLVRVSKCHLVKVKYRTLEKSHSRWKEDRHDPEFCRAREEAIERVHEENEDKVNMKYGDSREDDLEVPNPNGKDSALTVEQVQLSSQDDGVDDGSNDVQEAKGIKIGTAAVDDTWEEDGRHFDHNVSNCLWAVFKRRRYMRCRHSGLDTLD